MTPSSRVPSIAERDRVLRAFLRDKSWDLDPEERLRNKFLLEEIARIPEMASYIFLWGLEWSVEGEGVSEAGRGDAVLTDGHGRFAVLEFKYIDNTTSGATARTRRTKKRKEVLEQVKTYAAFFHRAHPSARAVAAYAVTNEGIWKLENSSGDMIRIL